MVKLLQTKQQTDWLGIFKTGANITDDITSWRSTMLDFATEIYLHANLMRSQCRTVDPSNALWFFIPTYTFYLFWHKRNADASWFDKILIPTQEWVRI